MHHKVMFILLGDYWGKLRKQVCVGFLSAVQILLGSCFIGIAFAVLACNVDIVTILWGIEIQIPGHIPCGRYPCASSPVIAGIFPDPAIHFVNFITDFFPIVVAGIGPPLIRTVLCFRDAQIFHCPVDKLCGCCLLFPLLCRGYHDVIGFLFVIYTFLVHRDQISNTLSNQVRNIHIFTGNAMFQFEFRARFQIVTVPISTVVLIFF